MKEKVTTVLRALLTPKTVILVLALYNFIVVWEATELWRGGLSCFLCPWYAPWSFTNEPTRMLLAACGLCLSMRWSYLAAAGLGGFTLFQGASVYAYLMQNGRFLESWVEAWRDDLNPMLSLHAQYLLASVIFVYAAVCFGRSMLRRGCRGRGGI